jgi:hypothetical protein
MIGLLHTHTHTHTMHAQTHTYIYIYIHIGIELQNIIYAVVYLFNIYISGTKKGKTKYFKHTV